jgi:hypothetical protein
VARQTTSAASATIAALRDRIQTELRANQRVLAQSLADRGALVPGVDVEPAAEVLWAIHHAHLWQLLVSRRGWTARGVRAGSGTRSAHSSSARSPPRDAARDAAS